MNQLYILEDDANYLDLLVECAAAEGWDVSAESVSLRFLEQGLPQGGVLVLDLVMPDKDGIEIIQHIAADKSRLGLILVSGFHSRILESAKLLAQANGVLVHDCLEKPIDLELFRKALRKAKQAMQG